MSALLESIPLESAWRLNALRMNASSLRFAAAATALANCAGLGLGEPDAFDGLAGLVYFNFGKFRAVGFARLLPAGGQANLLKP